MVLLLLVLVMLGGSYFAGSLPLVMNLSEASINPVCVFLFWSDC